MAIFDADRSMIVLAALVGGGCKRSCSTRLF
jgi:hypothetical protein